MEFLLEIKKCSRKTVVCKQNECMHHVFLYCLSVKQMSPLIICPSSHCLSLGKSSSMVWAGLQGGGEEQEGKRHVWVSACHEQQCILLPAVQLVWVNVSIYGLLYCEVKNFENSDFISFVV